ncbi:MAG: T9SS type A sorting domain-containing protein [Lunatimonas sp.]|uniref:T9SS type A sorting domain-containing protein n=1 Tax=Lunatimonas sp. TaxID=2060141 RepID=UPI00263A473E|nr:T9SS type A sorting domain-containing protein [Lunatimonas sp.]MCC5936348.1 T9SS type A sorting domain-containing protein [Lunatimonas sp.]
MRTAFFFLALMWTSLSQAQKTYRLASTGEVESAESQYAMPFAGGINAAQFQTLDTNGDGQEEYVVWDINARMVSVFREENGTFTHLPELSYAFPTDISGFLVLADFDGDGKKDLFTSSPFGIKAYRNTSTPSRLQWEEAQPFLRLDNGSNVTANSLDIPLILDLDGDGDLDILTFNFATGDYLEFYRNTSIERKGVADIDGFASAQVRWGAFEFCSCGNFSFGQTCAGQPIASATRIPEAARTEHAGGHSMLFHDFDGDGIRDLLLGQDECKTLYFLPNKGTDAAPVFDEFRTELPNLGPLPEFPIFHAAYLVKGNLLISTHSSEASAGFGIDFASSIYQYALTDETDSPGTRRFLQEHMIDLGENARPVFEGNRLNGVLTVTANQTNAGRVSGRAYRYTLQNGRWTEVTDDYLNLSQLHLRELSVQNYRAASGKVWIMVSGEEVINNIPEKKILWAEAEEPAALQATTIPGFILRGVDQPYFFSHQGADYLLLARQTGELVLFRVAIGATLTFELIERDFLGFSDNPVNRGLTVAVIPGSSPALVAVDQRGILRQIADFMENPSEIPLRIQLEENLLSVSRLGRNTWITPLLDPFSNKVDLILGTRAGGLMYLMDTSDDSVSPGEDMQVRLYPNPSSGRIVLLANLDANVTVIDASGRLVEEGIPLNANMETAHDLSHLPPGLYVVRVTGTQRTVHRKLIIKK